MGTKREPAQFDCYANAEPDEPMFTLLARDRVGADTVRWWVALRVLSGHPDGGIDDMRAELAPILALLNDEDGHAEAVEILGADEMRQLDEALECADAMEAWRVENRP